MKDELDRIASAVGSLVERVAFMPPGDAVAVVDAFERLGRVVAAGRLAALAAVDRARVWRGEGHASFAHWTAERTGTTVGHAVGALTAAKALAELPATREALASGALSVQQAGEIALAAQADRGSESALLAAAKDKSVAELREQCRMVKVAAAGDDVYQRMHRTRYLRFRSDRDSAVRVDGRFTPDAAAALMMWCQADADRRAGLNRRDGTIEPHEALMADALCSLPVKVSAAGSGLASDAAVRTTVYVHVDAAAWERGAAEPGDRCEIAGVGPTTVAAARRLASQPGGMLKIAIRNNGNVAGVVNTGRYVPAAVGSALEVRDERCVVRGCTRRRGLQRDHIVEFGRGGETSLRNLQRACAFHHYLKTSLGWTIVGEPPNCRIEPPRPP